MTFIYLDWGMELTLFLLLPDPFERRCVLILDILIHLNCQRWEKKQKYPSKLFFLRQQNNLCSHFDPIQPKWAESTMSVGLLSKKNNWFDQFCLWKNCKTSNNQKNILQVVSELFYNSVWADHTFGQAEDEE